MKPIDDVSYTPHAWVNAGTTGAFPLNATRANEIEAGIDDCADAINDILDATDDVDKWAAQADVLTYAGRSIADIPEIQTEPQQELPLRRLLPHRTYRRCLV